MSSQDQSQNVPLNLAAVPGLRRSSSESDHTLEKDWRKDRNRKTSSFHPRKGLKDPKGPKGLLEEHLSKIDKKEETSSSLKSPSPFECHSRGTGLQRPTCSTSERLGGAARSPGSTDGGEDVFLT